MNQLPSRDPASPGADQSWPWWPLLPLYPYGRRRTLVRELIPDQVWSLEQLQGVFYVAVPIRMTVVRVRTGLLLYAPVPPTGEVRAALAELEHRYGPVCTIVLHGLTNAWPLSKLKHSEISRLTWLRQVSFFG